MEFVFFACAVIGLTHILVDGKICQPLRNFFDKYFPSFFSSMIHCYQCTGFWAGMIVGLICFWPGISALHWVYGFLYTLAAGWAGSFLSNFAAIYFNYLDAQSIITLPDDPPQESKE